MNNNIDNNYNCNNCNNNNFNNYNKSNQLPSDITLSEILKMDITITNDNNKHTEEHMDMEELLNLFSTPPLISPIGNVNNVEYEEFEEDAESNNNKIINNNVMLSDAAMSITTEKNEIFEQLNINNVNKIIKNESLKNNINEENNILSQQEVFKNIDELTKQYIQDKCTDFLYEGEGNEDFITPEDLKSFIILLQNINSEPLEQIKELKDSFFTQQGLNKAILFNSLILYQIEIEELNEEYNTNNNNHLQRITKDDLDEHIIIELHQAIQTSDPLLFNKLLNYMNDQQDDVILHELYQALLIHYNNRKVPSIYSDQKQLRNYYNSRVIKNINNWDNCNIDAILIPNCGRRIFIQIENYIITDYWIKQVGDKKINYTIINNIQQVFDKNKYQFTEKTYIFEIIYTKSKEVNVLIIDCCIFNDQQLISLKYSERYLLLHQNLILNNENLYKLEGNFVNLQDIKKNVQQFLELNINSQFNIFPNKKNYLLKVDQPLSNNIKYIELDMSDHYKFLILGSFELKNKIKFIVATKKDDESESLKIIGLTNVSKQLESNLTNLTLLDKPPNNWTFYDQINIHPDGIHIYNEFISPSTTITYYDEYIIVDVNNYTKTTKSKIAKMTASMITIYNSNEINLYELFNILSPIDLNSKPKKIKNKKVPDLNLKTNKVSKIKLKKNLNKFEQCKLLLNDLSLEELNNIVKFIEIRDTTNTTINQHNNINQNNIINSNKNSKEHNNNNEIIKKKENIKNKNKLKIKIKKHYTTDEDDANMSDVGSDTTDTPWW